MSFNRLMIVFALVLTLSVLFSSGLVTAAYPQANTAYPPMPAGYSSGSVTGFVYKTVTTDAVPFAYIAIVNAANPNLIYATMETDETGRYRFNSINSGIGYRLIAKHEGFTDGDSGPFILPAGKIFKDVKITQNGDAGQITGPLLPNGSVMGKVTEVGTNRLMSGASVNLVSPTDSTIVYYSTSTDTNGVYRFEQLNDFTTSYQIQVMQSGYKDGYSLVFQVESGTTIDENIVLDHRPLEITPFADATPRTDTTEPTPTTAGAGLPIPGFELLIALSAVAIGVGIASRNQN